MISTVALLTAALSVSAASLRGKRQTTTCPDGTTVSNSACCAWIAVRDDLQANLFHNSCEAEAHETLRATFHDAIGFSTSGLGGGGADGSLIAFGESDEFAFAANAGLEDISLELKKFADNHNVSYGDIIQFAGAVGITNCLGAPTIQTFVGRPNAKAASPPGLIPLPTDDVATITARFQDAGIFANNMIWLLASHSIAGQNHVDPSVAGAPFDSTPGAFDTQFYLETLLKGTEMKEDASTGEVLSPLQGEFRIQSDFALARDPSTTCLWQLPLQLNGFINGVFAGAMTQMSQLGQDSSTLIDCTEIIPTSQPLTKSVSFPAGKTSADLEIPASPSCGALPSISTDSGPQPTIAPVPPPNFS